MCGRASLEVARTWPLRESTLGSTFYSLCGVENATWICRGLTPVLDLGPRIQVSCSTTPPPPHTPQPNGSFDRRELHSASSMASASN